MENIAVPLWVAGTAVTVIGSLIAWIVNGMLMSLKGIGVDVKETNADVKTISKTVVQVETELKDHIEFDDKRFDQGDSDRRELWEKLNNHIERRVK